jgi:hypothetical protein
MTWSWNDGVRQISENREVTNLGTGGVFGLIAISVVSGLTSGIAVSILRPFFCDPVDLDAELGPPDDNLPLPILSGGCILGF